jgi:uncharacterized membrane protein YgdD (TMEM256/DUF423 family)
MHRNYLASGALFGAMAVVLGAFGAHGLKQIVEVETVQVFQTGVQYQVYHALALVGVGIIYERYPNRMVTWAGVFFIAGIILFSGSLYTITAFKATESIGIKGIGIITPFGGLFFIVGWILLFLGVMKKK